MSIEEVLYFDPQAEIPVGFCADCGGCLYRPTLHCIRCERRSYGDAAGNE